MPRGGADALGNDDAGVKHGTSLDPRDRPRKGVPRTQAAPGTLRFTSAYRTRFQMTLLDSRSPNATYAWKDRSLRI